MIDRRQCVTWCPIDNTVAELDATLEVARALARGASQGADRR